MSGNDGDRRQRLGRARPGRARRLRLAAWLALVVLAGCAATRKPQVTGLPSGHAVRSHQVLLLSDERLQQESEILRELGDVRRRLYETLSIPEGEREVVVYLFADRDRYSRYMRETHPNLPARRAFFIGTPRELAVYAHWGDQVMVDLRHEYTHGLLHASVGQVPLWLDEGLAEYFEVGSTSPGEINPEHLTAVSQGVPLGWRPNLQRLEQLNEVYDMSREDYHEAWAWVHYLLHEAPGGRELVSQYLRELRRGQGAPPISARLGTGLATAEAHLPQYMARLTQTDRVMPAGYFAPRFGP